jgi:hypothetical protein
VVKDAVHDGKLSPNTLLLGAGFCSTPSFKDIKRLGVTQAFAGNDRTKRILEGQQHFACTVVRFSFAKLFAGFRVGL